MKLIYKFIQKQQYPAEQLAQYSGFITMNPYAALKGQTQTQTPYKPSFGQQLLSIGTQLGGAYLGGPGGTQFGKKVFGKTGGGLASLVYRDNGGRIDEADPSSMVAMREEDPLRATRTELESVLTSLAQKEKALDYQKHNLRSPEEIQRLAQERADERLALLKSQGGGDKSFARQQIANVLKAFGKGIIDPSGNVAKEFEEITDADLKKQQANKAKRDAQELLNLDKKFAAEDEAYGIPAKLKAKIHAIKLSKLDLLTKKAKLEKTLGEIKYGNRRKGKPKIVNQKQAEDVWNYLTTVMKYSSDAKQNAQMVAIMKNLDKKEQLIIANEINAAKDSDANLGEHDAVIKAIKKLGPDFFARAKKDATPGLLNFWSDNPFKD
jgi:hypothetical protein